MERELTATERELFKARLLDEAKQEKVKRQKREKFMRSASGLRTTSIRRFRKCSKRMQLHPYMVRNAVAYFRQMSSYTSIIRRLTAKRGAKKIFDGIKPEDIEKPQRFTFYDIAMTDYDIKH